MPLNDVDGEVPPSGQLREQVARAFSLPLGDHDVPHVGPSPCDVGIAIIGNEGGDVVLVRKFTPHGTLSLTVEPGKHCDDLVRPGHSVAFYVEEHNTRLPRSAFRGQTPNEIYFDTGREVPSKLTAGKAEARRRRLESNRMARCFVCA